MWMQKSVEGGGAMNVHDRNRFAQGSPYAAGGYSGGGAGGMGGLGVGAGAGDWKSKILESGQWLGGKVIEYGGKLARGASHESVPEHMRGVPHNDGRASWMADIRNSSFTNTDYQGGGFSGGATYQNDFATERPNAYSDYSSGVFKPSGSTAAYGARPASLSQERYSDHRSTHDKSGRRAKKKSESGKKSKKKSKKRRDASSDSSDASESESDSDTASVKESLSDASLSSDSEADRRKAKASKKHAKKKDSKKKKKKHSNSFYSDEDEDEDEDEDSDDNQSSSKAKGKAKKADNYSYSFDPSKLPPPPEEKSKKSSKESRSKKNSKSRGRRQSVESSDSDVQQDNQKAKHSKRGAKKGKEKPTVNESVDLLGVDFAPQPAASNANAQAYVQPQAASSNLLTSVFDAQPSADPLQDLAGLSFDAPAHTSQHNNAESPMMFGAQTQQQEQQPESLQQDPAGARFLKNLLPENDIVDLNTLASEKKPEKPSAAEKKSLNDLQKAKAGEQPVSVMAVNAHAAQQQQMMYQMGQMQLGHPATMQMQMQPMQMQMQMTPQQQQMMMMNAQMMQQQQQQQLLMQQQQQMRGAQSQPQNASTSPQGGAMFSSFQQ